MSEPLVSICCITYNHAPFIRQCLEGFLMQKLQAPSVSPKGGETGPNSVPFGEGREGAGPLFEILIHDDCSTDGTTEIVREYAAKYPDLIFPLYETENQYCKPGRESMDFYNYRRARGKYIATCEGDDYWTDPLKLQKQVDFMEANPEYSVCFHGVEVNDVRIGKRWIPDYHLANNEDGLDIPRIAFTTPYIQPLTMLFRVSMFSYDWSKQYHGYRDTHEIYHLLRAGKGRFLNFDGGVYNMHQGGISAGIDTLTSVGEEYLHVTELYQHNRDDKDLRKYLQSILLWVLDVYKNRYIKSDYWRTIKDILHDTPDIWPSIMWIQVKRVIKHIGKR